ncbi:cytochrome b/b6 domain-containing protein [Nitratifractor salsuginis]|uniref:Ni-Fe hydrogenase, cytochrome b subunit n=1 Tax=Nitratifractor salsuginis (strain DSM 16511 / JCM 12458 / E9I37-1) TaxID=749222 RepID=E6WYA1_NITSE|nr:cytochrome b/b6 domain-containing protein [Nitratifractor salsuginis]ADV45349.1 Ni-Fe hydrogenase, cytochrome b subunit [Nitratifractor salsuginis DSM 16511]
MKTGYRKVKRMTAAMRINHWIVAICMVAAVVTGLYIGHPYYQTLIAEPAVDKYVMAWNRWVHLMAAIIFDVSSVVVFYLYFFSRFEKPILKLLPTPKNIVEFVMVFVNLITFNRVKKFDSSHADSFNAVYFFIFHLLLLWMLFSGLQLYVHGLESGHSSIGDWWPAMLHWATDWTVAFTGGTYMDVRYWHHAAMYFVIVWVLFHIYYEVWRTIFWQEGDIAIVFGGSKFAKEDQ